MGDGALSMSVDPSFLKRISLYFKMVKFSHSVFALPFAYTSALIADEGIPKAEKLFWITLAMLSARTTAMGANRVIDRKLDSLNPRTKDREIPAKKVSVSSAIILSLFSAVVLVFSAYMLNPLCFKLSPLALLVIVLYPYTKRFTWLSHFILGLALSAAPLGAWIAIRESLEIGSITLAISVLFWTAGFDTIYALQDIGFDRAYRLHSIPQRIGVRDSLWLSRFFHLISWNLLLLTGLIFGLGFFYWLGLIIIAGLFIYEHTLINAEDLSRINTAFFNMNGYISLTVFLFTLLNYM